ncbi:hypothetical protein D9757_000539 [Collybiopsis confluens]|uniref:BRCT domain-containing protein n=1 Tax=Collybiopsis confluens TaxID=2823264 RepID=A0A8H5I1S2_9AGAR|nr:hypothetical protein D9757_000539 [Collybiopsis confluens]
MARRSQPSPSDDDFSQLFIDPMLGTPLSLYVEKDIQDKDILVDLIIKHGGNVASAYSGVTYILVDPLKPSGQNLYRQYAVKKTKVVLSYRWVHECIKSRQLQTFQTNWAGCKVIGNETLSPTPAEILSQTSSRVNSITPQAPAEPVLPDSPRRRNRQTTQSRQIAPHAPLPPIHPQILHPIHVEPHYPSYQLYTPPPAHTLQPQRTLQTPLPQTAWQGAGIAPHQTHMNPSSPLLHRPEYREDDWESYNHSSHSTEANPSYNEFRDPRDHSPWVSAATNTYYEPVQYGQAYSHDDYVQDADAEPDSSEPPREESHPPEKTRGRKRIRASATPAKPASELVANRKPLARSPTPPNRTVKSTYGGNLFTSDDVLYLKRYIDYCQDQGMVLSKGATSIFSARPVLISIPSHKAPHHTFYSWRRYCNKHQIRLGGYAMNMERSETPQSDGGAIDEEHDTIQAGPGPGTVAAAHRRHRAASGGSSGSNRSSGDRGRSPTPPRALFRSTTGKGVAFTDEDVSFLVRFMKYRKSQGNFDMVAFWKDVAIKAPHHSRASWMKFWRRHKHELERNDGDEPLPQPPDKKMRYSRGDDVLLAKFFCNKPDGTSDKIFQAFARMHPHHPWKGWQEHHRIHKAKVDHFIERLKNGENIDIDEDAAE